MIEIDQTRFLITKKHIEDKESQNAMKGNDQRLWCLISERKPRVFVVWCLFFVKGISEKGRPGGGFQYCLFSPLFGEDSHFY